MRRLISGWICLAVLLISMVPSNLANAASHYKNSNWNLRDRAVYVVSTLNLLHTRGGHPLTAILSHRLHVTHFDVYADEAVDNLSYIELRRADESSVGALAYKLGWVAPMSVSSSLDRLHMREAPSDVVADYRNDTKQLIGSFTSTVPS